MQLYKLENFGTPLKRVHISLHRHPSQKSAHLPSPNSHLANRTKNGPNPDQIQKMYKMFQIYFILMPPLKEMPAKVFSADF